MSKNLPKISVITPSFNQGQYIEQTIKSILDQDYPNIEHIVMDGGSTDETLSILKRYSNRIKWVSKKDKGQTDAINKGIKMATGDILAYINSDDYYLPGTFNKVVNFFNKNPKYKWVTGDYIIVDAENKQIQKPIVVYKRFFRAIPYNFSLFILNHVPQPSTFWKREITKDIGPFNVNLRYVMDYDFWLRTIKKYNMGKIKDPLSAFRIHSQSKGGVDYKKQFSEEFEILKKNTDNTLLRGLHALHNYIIVQVYNRIK